MFETVAMRSYSQTKAHNISRATKKRRNFPRCRLQIVRLSSQPLPCQPALFTPHSLLDGLILRLSFVGLCATCRLREAEASEWMGVLGRSVLGRAATWVRGFWEFPLLTLATGKLQNNCGTVRKHITKPLTQLTACPGRSAEKDRYSLKARICSPDWPFSTAFPYPKLSSLPVDRNMPKS